jgi:hypothetical protein
MLGIPVQLVLRTILHLTIGLDGSRGSSSILWVRSLRALGRRPRPQTGWLDSLYQQVGLQPEALPMNSTPASSPPCHSRSCSHFDFSTSFVSEQDG